MRKFIFIFAFLFPLLAQAQQEVKTDSVTTLDEVVVTAEMVNRFSDHKDYVLTRSEKQQFQRRFRQYRHCPRFWYLI